jgi:hypothetical protein
VSTAHPDANYGTTPTLGADATPKIRSYLRFRLDGLSGRVVHAQLRLWSPTGDLVGYRVHPVASTGWDERGITWKNGPRAGDPVAKSGPFGPGSWSSTDVTRLVEGNDEVSVAMTTRSQQNVTFDSREGLHKPQLVVQTTPAPVAARPAAPGQWLKSTIENVAGATSARYATRTTHGKLAETLKLISSVSGDKQS